MKRLVVLEIQVSKEEPRALEGPPLRASDCLAGEGHAETSGLRQPAVSGS